MITINRRKFLKTAGTGVTGAVTIAAPAIAQSALELNWRLTASWPRYLDTLYGAAEQFAKFVAEATNNKFAIKCFGAGELVPGLQATDAVASGAVEMCHTASSYMWDRDPTFAFGCAVPFGLNSRQQNAWWTEGGGEALMNEFYAKQNLYGLLAGNTGAQMGGWFRKEINTPDDLKGLKMRIGGLAGAIISRLGVIPQQIAGGDISGAFEKGIIDAAEWVGPYDDEKLGFHKFAKYYYYPGWWESGAMLHIHVNKEKWDSLPKSYQAICKAAAAEANQFCLGRYDIQNPTAVKRLVALGAQLRPFSETVLDACFKVSNEVYAEISNRNEDFKKIWEHIKVFRQDHFLWLQLPDNTYDTYMMIQQRKRTL
jgi:TRAP-type mannitol/chloroaromatic compound transport system substrate-binding protein